MTNIQVIETRLKFIYSSVVWHFVDSFHQLRVHFLFFIRAYRCSMLQPFVLEVHEISSVEWSYRSTLSYLSNSLVNTLLIVRFENCSCNSILFVELKNMNRHSATASSSSSSSSSDDNSKNDGDEKDRDDQIFECNICLDTAKDAVISMCGHLFW